MKIYALDDEKSALKLITLAVKTVKPEADIICFDSAPAALEECRKNPPDVMFLDINMPVMTGLEFARELKQIKKDVNIIFVTGYSEFALDAFSLYASGYVTKPVTAEDIEKEFNHLRYPVKEGTKEKKVRVKTFGSFDIFIDGKAVPFHRIRSKEVLAYLVDRQGSSVTRKEIAAVVFDEDDYSRSTQAYLTMILRSLSESLNDAGIGDLLVVSRNSYSVDTTKFTCDAYEFLAGDPAAKKQFTGEYMFQYSWAEENIGQFLDF